MVSFLPIASAPIGDLGGQTTPPNPIDPDPNPPNIEIIYQDPDVSPPPISSPEQEGAAQGYGWSAGVVMNGVDITSQISGPIIVRGKRNTATTADFSFIPTAGAIDISEWIGKSVVISYTRQAKKTIFTGVVERPSINPGEKEVSCLCTSGRKSLISGMTKAQIDSTVGGWWSEYVFDKNADNLTYFLDRLSTRSVGYNINRLGAGVLYSLEASQAPHYTFTDSHVHADTAKCVLADRSRIINQSVLTFDFSYSRLRQRERDYRWFSPHTFNYYITTNSFDVPTKAMIFDASQATGWMHKEVSVDVLPPSGVYAGQNFVNSRTDFVMDTEFKLAKRFSQAIIESYVVTIDSPQSQTEIGINPAAVSYSMSAEYDAAEWEEFLSYSPAPASFSASPNGDSFYDEVGKEIDGRKAFNNAIKTAIAIEVEKIRASHRQNEVRFSVDCQPEIDAYHTVSVAADDGNMALSADGVVDSFTHWLDMAEDENRTDIAITPSKTGAAGEPSAYSVSEPPIADTADDALTTGVTTLGTHLAYQPGDPAYDETWEGHTGNYASKVAGAPFYPYRFQVRSQPIGAIDRSERKVESPSTVQIPITIDLLNISVS